VIVGEYKSSQHSEALSVIFPYPETFAPQSQHRGTMQLISMALHCATLLLYWINSVAHVRKYFDAMYTLKM